MRASEIARSIEADLPDMEAMKAVIPDLKENVENSISAIQNIQNELATLESRGGRTAA